MVHNWLENHTVISGSQSSWWGISSGVLQGSVLHLVLFSFINDLDNGIESTLIKVSDDTKLGGVASSLEDRISIQSDLDKTGEII